MKTAEMEDETKMIEQVINMRNMCGSEIQCISISTLSSQFILNVQFECKLFAFNYF